MWVKTTVHTGIYRSFQGEKGEECSFAIMPRRLHHPRSHLTLQLPSRNKILQLAGAQFRRVRPVVILLPSNPNDKDKNSEGDGDDRKEPPL